MNEKQRLVVFILLASAMMLGTQALFSYLGLMPPAQPPAPAAQQPQQQEPEKPQADLAKAEPPKAEPPKAEAKGEGQDQAKAQPAAPKPAPIAIIPAEDLVLGSASDQSPGGYRMAVQLLQKGAGVESLALSRFEAEFVGGKNRHLPLRLIERDVTVPPSFVMTLDSLTGPGLPKPDPTVPQASRLDYETWEVVKDAQGRTVHPVKRIDPATKAELAGQELVFRTTVGEPAVTITKTYRLFQGQDGFELDLGFSSPSAERSVVYELLGPHNLPIEGQWYTINFRDVFFGQLGLPIKTRAAQEIVKEKSAPKWLSASPLLYTGVENQYFCVFIEPEPRPTSKDTNHIAKTFATVIHEDEKKPQMSDISVQLVSDPVELGPNREVTHHFRVYAGPKRVRELLPFGAPEIASYRKSGWFFIPFASTLASSVISPLLERIYGFTTAVAHFFGGKHGNYGVAIILLTITVRLLMFPLSRKQAISAKRMQDLQPLLNELKEKYKDDKEKIGRETLALYGKHGVNPVSGCLPALIQLPIFVGLWQALNNSVDLRHASFLWIKDLAAPDMLFRFPFSLWPLGEYFNLLPFVVVSLMLIQTKLFSPPATTPDAEMQMKTMRVMMVVMGLMFYWVPSGLGIYFITSSLWAICERLLLPKLTGSKTTPPALGKSDDGPAPGGGSSGGGRGPSGRGPAPSDGQGGWWAQQKEKLEKLVEEASKDRTYRNEDREAPRERDRDRDRSQRPKPGRRR